MLNGALKGSDQKRENRRRSNAGLSVEDRFSHGMMYDTNDFLVKWIPERE
jgi:hypothetical protein